MGQIINSAGQRFGRLLVLGDSRKRGKGGHAIWDCFCDCGKIVAIMGDNLRRGKTRSCGCFQKDYAREAHFKHGDASRIDGETRLYITWVNMNARCCYKSGKYFKRYGGRGITVCDEWKDDYAMFKAWALSHGYADTLTIDRIDNNKGYYPENCQWLSRSENSRKGLRKENGTRVRNLQAF